MSDAFLSIAGLSLSLGQFTLGPISLELRRRDYLVLMGASGCGKTSLLRTIAGLYGLAAGAIVCNGRDISRLPPQRRRIGYVSQGQSLFPHMTVRQNVQFGLDYCRISPAEQVERFTQIVALVGIGHLLDRHPGSLSGGEARRVGLARALVIKPDILLLDEPLSMLDPRARRELLHILRHIHDATDSVTIHVTHEAGELWAQGRLAAVMQAGRIVRFGPPETFAAGPFRDYVRNLVASGPDVPLREDAP